MSLRVFVAVLALIIGGALVWVITAGSEDPASTPRATSIEERKAVRIEERLVKDPTNKALLVAVMKTWIDAGNERLNALDPFKRPFRILAPVAEDFETGLRAWGRYLAQTNGKAGRDIAESAAGTYFQLVEIGSTDPHKATANVVAAVEAEKIVCKHDPSLYTLSHLATYHYFNGENAAGDRAAREAAADSSPTDAIEPREVIEELNEYKEQGERFVARVKQGFETLEETGEEELEEPIKGYGSPAGINGYEPGTGPS